jgi:uncharacterized protein (TIGR00288 family)
MSPIIVAGDIDVQMAVEAFEAIRNPNIDVVALMTRNTDFLPLVNIAKENGKETIVIGAEPGFSIALKNSADSTIVLKNNTTTPTLMEQCKSLTEQCKYYFSYLFLKPPIILLTN